MVPMTTARHYDDDSLLLIVTDIVNDIINNEMKQIGSMIINEVSRSCDGHVTDYYCYYYYSY